MGAFPRLFLSLGLLVWSLAAARAESDPPALPTHETLARLLSYESRALENQIKIGVVVRGEADLSRKFKTDHAIHVTFIWPVSEGGRRVRTTDTRIFLWNEDYGWFSYQEGIRQGSAVIDVCSELLGMIEIK